MFQSASANDHESIEKIKLLLQQNEPPIFFDLLSRTYADIALASAGKLELCEDEVHILDMVRRLCRLDNQCGMHAPYLMMMLLWPKVNSSEPYTSSDQLLTQIEELRRRWRELERKPSQSAPQASYAKLVRHKPVRKKPITFLFLGAGDNLRRFVHIHQLKASTFQIESQGDRFWTSDKVTKTLVRLNGILLDKSTLVFLTPEKKKIKIHMAVPRVDLPSQESVTFFLGFSWAGPIAYDVEDKSKKRRAINKKFTKAYPAHFSFGTDKIKAHFQETIQNIEKLKKRKRTTLSEEEVSIMLVKVKSVAGNEGA